MPSELPSDFSPPGRNEPADEKIAVRKMASRHRQQLALADPDAAKRLAARVNTLIASFGKGTYAGYVPIHSELSPLLLLNALAGRGVQTALPVTPAPGHPLRFHAWRHGGRLVDGRYGTRQPADDAPVLRPHVILAPLLAFDGECWRLGYGGGYYDRTLDCLRRDGDAVAAVGIAFKGQRLDKIPTGPYDMRLDAVLCPDGLIVAT
jgi:5-formyltetrahydrofolate cyclo-ligase